MNSKLRDFFDRGHLKSWGYSVALGLRSTHYFSQAVLGSVLLGRKPTPEQAKTLAPTSLILKKLWKLFQTDAENISNGIYATPKDWIDPPLKFLKTSLRAILDLYAVKGRQSKKLVQEIPTKDEFAKLPKYYRQNFHFQTDGWLSQHSADLYDHQVEVVFAGGAGAMRRQALPIVMDYARQSLIAEHELKILDIASGTGLFARELKQNLPQAHLTVNDLSPFYLKKARSILSETIGTDFIEANAESLPLKDAQYDIITCVFLFHELPRLVRSKVANEMHRLLKPGGLFVLVDSIQLDDDPDLNGSLKYFPVHYHEPYYLDYINQPQEEYLPRSQWSVHEQKIALFSKISAFKKL